MFNKTWTGVSSILVYRVYEGLFNKTWTGSSSILQCTGNMKAYLIKHGLARLLSYSVQGI